MDVFIPTDYCVRVYNREIKMHIQQKWSAEDILMIYDVSGSARLPAMTVGKGKGKGKGKVGPKLGGGLLVLVDKYDSFPVPILSLFSLSCM